MLVSRIRLRETWLEGAPVIVPRVLWAPAITGQSVCGSDRVERFLARLAVEMMAPSKISFPAARQFYCLESSSTFMRSRGNRFLASLETTCTQSVDAAAYWLAVSPCCWSWPPAAIALWR